jgi:hypothetical protein
MAGEPLEVKPVAKPLPAPPREGKIDEGERKPGILPPPMAAPKPTS